MKQPLYKAIASTLQAYNNCVKSNNTEWQEKHEERLSYICKDYMPSGSGIDSGITFNMELSKPDKLVFDFSYHHMGEGYYKKWTQHRLYVTPSLVNDFDLKITGENYNDVKEYLYQLFNDALCMIVE